MIVQQGPWGVGGGKQGTYPPSSSFLEEKLKLEKEAYRTLPPKP
jgi:hypothetical protein